MTRFFPSWCILLMVCALELPAQGQPAAPAAVPVGTVTAQRKAIDQTLDFVGRVEAVGRVEIRARVTGFLDAVLFKEGELIKEGAPLYRIEPDLFDAAVKQAEGALERTKAAYTLAAIQLQRAQELLDRNSGTVVARDQARAALDQAKGAVTGDEADLQTARINLGYTQITAPIAGPIGRTSVTKGNVVGPNSGELTTIVSQDPIYVTFPVSQREFLRYQQGEGVPDRSKVEVRIRFQDGSDYGQVGRVNFVDVTVDRTTDTVIVRATMPNPDGALVDGQLVRVVVQGGKPEEKPGAAGGADYRSAGRLCLHRQGRQGGDPAAQASARSSGPDAVVESGLTGGEQVVVQGLQTLRPGPARDRQPDPHRRARLRP